MQTITITGYLSRDAETGTTRDGVEYTRWNVPVKQGYKETEQTNWYRVTIWGARAKFAANARKGEHATVTGDLTIGDYQGKPQYEIRASDFHSVTTGKRDEQASQPQTSQAPDYADDLEDEVPFD